MQATWKATSVGHPDGGSVYGAWILDWSPMHTLENSRTRRILARSMLWSFGSGWQRRSVPTDSTVDSTSAIPLICSLPEETMAEDSDTWMLRADTREEEEEADVADVWMPSREPPSTVMLPGGRPAEEHARASKRPSWAISGAVRKTFPRKSMLEPPPRARQRYSSATGVRLALSPRMLTWRSPASRTARWAPR